MAKEFQGTRVNLAVAGENGETETLRNLTEKAANEQIEAAKSAGQPEPTPVKIQTFTYHEAETPADFAALVADEAEQVNIFNIGYASKQNRIVREFMSDDDQAAIEGSYDLLTDAASRTERRKATPEEKALRDLQKLAEVDPSALARILQQFASVGA